MYATTVRLKAFKALETEVFLHIYGTTFFEHLWESRNCSIYRVRYQLNDRFSNYSSECRHSTFVHLLVFTIKDKSVNESSKNITGQYNLTSSWHHMKVNYQPYTLSPVTLVSRISASLQVDMEYMLQQAVTYHPEICVSDLNMRKKLRPMEAGV